MVLETACYLGFTLEHCDDDNADDNDDDDDDVLVSLTCEAMSCIEALSAATRHVTSLRHPSDVITCPLILSIHLQTDGCSVYTNQHFNIYLEAVGLQYSMSINGFTLTS